MVIFALSILRDFLRLWSMLGNPSEQTASSYNRAIFYYSSWGQQDISADPHIIAYDGSLLGSEALLTHGNICAIEPVILSKNQVFIFIVNQTIISLLSFLEISLTVRSLSTLINIKGAK